MDRTWKIYGILAVLGGLLFGPAGTPNASSSTEPTVPSASIPSGQSAAPALDDATPPLVRRLHRVAKDPPQKAKDLLGQFSNMRATLSLDISVAERFRIVKDGCLAVTTASMM